jgi:hypothetical protein
LGKLVYNQDDISNKPLLFETEQTWEKQQNHFLVEADWITLSMNQRMAAALLEFTVPSARDKTDTFL